jgi:protein SCO1
VTRVRLLLGLIGLMAGLALSLILFIVSRNGASPVLNTAGAYEGTALDAALAADFRLVDQKGANVALSDFWGKIVALTFMDSQCVDTCPKTAAHFRQVYRTLGDEADLVFIGVNVNLKANHVVDVMLTTARWQLTEIPTWHFLTGSAEALEPVWKAYDVMALPDSGGTSALVHTPGVFLIDRAGQKRWYVSTPYDETGGSQVSFPLNELLVKHIRQLLKE